MSRQRQELPRSWPSLLQHSPCKTLTKDRPPAQRQYRRFTWDFALAGRPDRAQSLLELDLAWRPQSQVENPGFRNGLRRVEAAIAVADDRAADAVELLLAVRRDNSLCVACDLPDLGSAYDRAGNVDSAIAYYQRYLETPGFRDAQRWEAIVLRRLGELLEARGDVENAIEYYDRFVELWKDADAELQPLVADIRARIARLVGENR